MSVHAAGLVVELLEAAGVEAGLRIPQPRPAAGFCRALLMPGRSTVSPGVTVVRYVEVEAWHPRPTPALEMADAAIVAVVAAAGTRGIRHVWVDNEVADLPTGEAGWARYRFTLALEFREAKERLGR